MRRWRVVILHYPTETIVGEFDTENEMEEACRPHIWNSPGLRLDFWVDGRWVRGWHHSQYPTS